MYSIAGYGKMIADGVRMAAYRAALRRVIQPGCVVLDIGCGTGIFSMIACQLGARRVYAVEPDEAIEVAREIALAHGYDDRIDFIQARSDEIDLPEKADVMVSDLRGILPLFERHIPSVVDARKRLLASGGVQIPGRDLLWAAVVEAPDLYSQFFRGWNDQTSGFDMTAARKIVANTWAKGRVEPAQLLVEPQCWATLDYRSVVSADVDAKLSWTVRRPGTAAGLVLWFDSHLIDGVTLSNAPSAPELIYGSAFFPWPEPVPVTEQDRIEVALSARLLEADYIWRWTSTVLTGEPSARSKAKFDQSTFHGAPLTLASLRTRAESFVPQLDEVGQVDGWILAAMDGATSVGDIARAAMVRFPSRFTDWPAALATVADLARRHSRNSVPATYRRKPTG